MAEADGRSRWPKPMAKAGGQSRWPMALLLLARRFGRRGEGLRGRRANPVAGALLLLARWLGRCSLRRQRRGVGHSPTGVRPPRAEENGSRSGTRAVRRGKEANDIVDSGRRERNGTRFQIGARASVGLDEGVQETVEKQKTELAASPTLVTAATAALSTRPRSAY